MVKRVKSVVKMFWKRLGSESLNSARSTTEKRTGNCLGSNHYQMPTAEPPPTRSHLGPLDLLLPTPNRPRPAAARPPLHRIQRQVNMRVRIAVMDGKDPLRVPVTSWRLVRILWAVERKSELVGMEVESCGW